MLYTQRHDRIDNVVVVFLQSFDSLLPRYACLLHDEFNVLALQASFVDLLIIILFLFLGITGINCLALAVIVGSLCCFGVGELLSGSSLRLGIKVFDLSLTKDAEIRLAFGFVCECA
jgi:hypothetical protein